MGWAQLTNHLHQGAGETYSYAFQRKGKHKEKKYSKREGAFGSDQRPIGRIKKNSTYQLKSILVILLFNKYILNTYKGSNGLSRWTYE